MNKIILPLSAFALAWCAASAQSTLQAEVREPNLIGHLERPLRYTPEGGDFVIHNGDEYFNRPLYGGNTAFRVDAGDRPEFALYLPGRGGNLRLGIRTAQGAAKWLQHADTIVARYRPGTMRYEIRDPILGGKGSIELTAIALAQTEGLIVRVEAHNIIEGLELVWAYGGANGKRGRRDGDIGTESVPISEYFQLQPAYCTAQTFAVEGHTFSLQGPTTKLTGVFPRSATLAVRDAALWNECARLLDSVPTTNPIHPVLVGSVALTLTRPIHLAIQRANPDAAPELAEYRALAEPSITAEKKPAASTLAAIYAAEDLPRVFADADSHFRRLRERVQVETPDAFINAAVGALNVAADAIWDEPQGVVMHGAIAWRTRLLGWRGPYAMDALGWHERARRHLSYWAQQQNISPIPKCLPPPDEDSNLARQEQALHSNGDLSKSHYDMNLVYIDALFRHLLWTGDVDFAREMWPVIQRHLAWERRLFRREFTADGETLPLYEAYAAIWASDDLQYHGGGVTHASAYNYYHQTMAARLARLLGEDPAPYMHEADLIARGMRAHLWSASMGTFGEFKDALGRQRLHPHAALWTIYHTIDSQVTSPAEASRMVDYVKNQLPALPVHGPGVPTDRLYHVYATSNWMPYEWSINNVVMGENLHTALAFWQAGNADDAYGLMKSSLLAAMFMGICPGNVGSMSYLDVYRRESQRDFADGSGVMSRALVEGLFGCRPDALAGELLIVPGWPSTWTNAKLKHPDISLSYLQKGASETYLVNPRFAHQLALTLRVPARRLVARVIVNGQEVEAVLVRNRGPHAFLEIRPAAHENYTVTIEWAGEPVEPECPVVPPAKPKFTSRPYLEVEEAKSFPPDTKFEPLDLSLAFNDRVTRIFQQEYRSPRSSGVSLAQPKQGLGGWAGSFNASAEIDDTGLRRLADKQGGKIFLPNGMPFSTPGPGESPNVLFTSLWDNYPTEHTVVLSGRARTIFLLLAGTTNWMQSRIDNGEVIVTYVDGSTARLALHNPTTWWPIEQNYFIDDYQFPLIGSRPLRVHLKTGEVNSVTGPGHGEKIPGGAAVVLTLTLNPQKELRSLTVRALANEVVIGLMSATLVR